MGPSFVLCINFSGHVLQMEPHRMLRDWPNCTRVKFLSSNMRRWQKSPRLLCQSYSRSNSWALWDQVYSFKISKRPFGAVCVCQKTKHIFVDKYHVGLEDDSWYIDVDDKDLQSIKDITLFFSVVEEAKRESEKRVIFKSWKYTKC